MEKQSLGNEGKLKELGHCADNLENNQWEMKNKGLGCYIDNLN